MAPTSKILKNGTLLSFEDVTQSVKVLQNASLLLKDGRIEAIAEDGRLMTVPEDCEIVDVSGKIVSPGFINTHLHAWMTAYRTMSPDVTLTHYLDWLGPTSATARKAYAAEDIYWSALEGFLEGLNGGVTTFLDHDHACWSPEVMVKGYEAAADSGARIWWCCEPQDKTEGFRIEEQWAVLGQLAKSEMRSALVPIGLSYQGLAGAKGEEFAIVKKMVHDLGIDAITVHHVGGPWPAINTSPVSFVQQDVQSLGVPIIFSHASYLTREEQQVLRDQNFHVSITPESEMRYGHGQTTGHLVSDQASLGVDTAFTFSGDMLTQARMWLQQARNTSFQSHLQDTGLLPRNTPLTAEQGFLLATRQGGKALWRDDIGVLKVGATADLVVFDGDSPNMLGWSDAVAAVMLHANVGDIQHVFVDGEFRKKDFKLVDGKRKWSEVRERFVEIAPRVQKMALEMMTDVPERLWSLAPTGDVEILSTIRKP